MPDLEALARIEIDDLLGQAGWVVQGRSAMNLIAGEGVTIRKVSIPGAAGEADDLLIVGGKAIGILEAKAVGTTLKGVEVQTAGYAQTLPDHIPSSRLSLPMLYESTGKETRFTTPDDDRKFTALYNVQHLRSSRIDGVSRVCISTIQHVYSILSGDEELDESLEEGSMFENGRRAVPQPKKGSTWS